ncbi:hypothetical protein CHARACLAT_031855 [Characodon lateralis]|uniref:Uncharacterized protein n=1 Tax=Characodon lateralis TaxID=208331 RepID=A0ABU7DXZ0_9TELE|nr:hypothetical protein [Characodon lateralis]
MGLLRSTMPLKIQLLAVLAFGVAMLLIENQIQRLDESRAKLAPLSLSFLGLYLSNFSEMLLRMAFIVKKSLA